MITLGKAAEISQAKLRTLRESFQIQVHNWYAEMALHIPVITPYIYEGFRTNARQDELYAIGRTVEGKVVTNAQAGQSFHNYGLAFDWVPLMRVVKADGMYDCDWDNDTIYKIGAEIGMKYGLRALSWETPHLEDAHFANWRELANESKGSSTPS